MPTKLSVFANCQANPLASTLNMICPEIEIIRCPPVHTIAKDSAPEILRLISEADIIIHQPIGKHFGVISSDALRAELPVKTFLTFPSIYFSGLFPQLGYLRLPSGESLVGPLGEYHDMRIVLAFQKNIPARECVNFISEDDSCYQEYFVEALSESRKREASTDIPIMDTIEASLPERPCLYTFNHPDNLILHHIAITALELLGLPINKSQRPRVRPFLDNVIAAIPRRVSQMLGASWTRNYYSYQGEQLHISEIVQSFYTVYSGVPNFSSLVEFNRHRINIHPSWPSAGFINRG
jgi:hypothetical protein